LDGGILDIRVDIILDVIVHPVQPLIATTSFRNKSIQIVTLCASHFEASLKQVNRSMHLHQSGHDLKARFVKEHPNRISINPSWF
jgi:hypothetical protein